ncbi:MAG: hypothetical protein WAT46_09470 [Saprospiraceae bacterium]
MGFIEDKIKEIESEKVDFLQELEERIDRLKKEGHIGRPNHLHFTVGGDVRFKYLMAKTLISRGVPVYMEGKKLGNKFIADCSEKAYEEVIVFTLDSLGPIVYDKYQSIADKFWESVNEMFIEVK